MAVSHYHKKEKAMRQFDFSKIKEFREEAKITQDALASLMSTDESRVYVQQISAWEQHKKSDLTVSSLVKLAAALGKTPDDFFIDNQS